MLDGVELNWPTNLLVPSISFASAGIAFVVFQLTPNVIALPVRWENHALFLLSVFALCGIPIALARTSSVRVIYLCVQLMIIWISAIPDPNPFSLSFYLVLGVIVETIFALPSIYSFVTGLAAVSLVLLTPKNILVFGEELVHGDPQRMVLFVFQIIVFAGFGFGIRQVIRHSVEADTVRSQLEEAMYRLADSNMKLQEYSAIIEQHAMEDERKRISQEVHDILGHTLTTVNMTLQASISLATNCENQQLSSMLSGAREHVKSGMQELRRALASLAEEPPMQKPYITKILDLTRNVSAATGIKIGIDFANTGLSLAADRASILYRLVQEGITNAIRHGNATEIHIHFQRIDTGLMVFVRDNGRGSASREPGFGLQSMEDRIASIDGTLKFSSEPQHGTTIEAWLPIDEKAETKVKKSDGGRVL
jgi:signal transduction histidine kinase